MSADTLTLEVQLAFDRFGLDVSDEIDLAGVTALFGPSGGGKSTLLRCIAGFETPHAGRIVCGGDPWFDASKGIDLAPHRRPVGTMFQDTRLFPHLDVGGNLDYADRRRGRDGQGPERADVVAALDLESLQERRTGSLSGGERQRVALARTLLRGPRLLLLDEPLAALDRHRKADILPYLENLQRQFGIPTLYVSHDVDEIVELSERALLLVDGRVQFHGPIAEAVENLELQTLDGRFDAGVLLDGTIAGHDARLRVTYVDIGGGNLTMPLADRLPEGATIRLRVRARDVAIATRKPEGISIRNILPGTLAALDGEPDRGFVSALVATGSARIRAHLTLAAVEDLDLAVGQTVYALVKSVSFDRRT